RTQLGTAAARGEDVVVELVAEHGDLAAHALAAQAQEGVEPEASLVPDAGIPHIVGVGGEVRAVGVQLVEVGRAVRAAGAHAHAYVLGQEVEQAERAGERAERARPDRDALAAGQHERHGVARHVARPVVPRADLRPERAGAQLLDDERGKGVVVRGRRTERAARRDVAVLRAYADGALCERAVLAVSGDELATVQPLRELRARRAALLQLDVVVVAGGAGQLDLRERSGFRVERRLTAQRVARHLDVHGVVVVVLVLVLVLVLVPPDARDAVLVAVEPVGQARMAPVADPRAAHGPAVGPHAGVVQRAGRCADVAGGPRA